ncbi:SpaA isopeptide-forming pilin-related protein [Aerococcaceae bacterium NML180378]|nr:SpaA isopeptide-forming pilin-related protein [Aerococcaceae bacterium NML180378]
MKLKKLLVSLALLFAFTTYEGTVQAQEISEPTIEAVEVSNEAEVTSVVPTTNESETEAQTESETKEVAAETIAKTEKSENAPPSEEAQAITANILSELTQDEDGRIAVSEAGFNAFRSVMASPTNNILTREKLDGYSIYYNVQMDGGNTEGWETSVYVYKINGEYVFCLEPLVSAAIDESYEGSEIPLDGTFTLPNSAKGYAAGVTITPELGKRLEKIRVIGLGATNQTFQDALFAGLMMWEEILPGKFSIDYTSQWNRPNFLAEKRAEYEAFKRLANHAIDTYINHTSWTETTHNLDKGQSINLVDKNNIFPQLIIPSEQNGFLFEKVDNSTLKVTAGENAQSGKIIFGADRTNKPKTTIIYRHPGKQTLASLVMRDPIFANINLIVNPPKVGSILLSKVTSEGQVLPGTEFELLKDNVVVATQTTGQDGKLTFTELLEGLYSVREKDAPQGYVLNTEVKSVNVTAGQQAVVDFVNQVQKGLIEIAKVSRKNGTVMINERYSLAGAEFGVFKGTEQIGTIITDEAGKGRLENLALGNYTVRELKAPKGFLKTDEVFEVNLTAENKTDAVFSKLVTIANDEILGRIKVLKLDKETGSTLANAVYGIYDVNNKEVARLTTDNNGYAISSLLPLATYKVKELSAPYGYILDAVAQAVNLVDSSTKEMTFRNIPQKGLIEIAKVSRKNGTKMINESYSLAGAEFGVFSNGYLVSKIVTDETGKGRLADLALGNYTVKEIKAPKGFLLSDKVFEVVLTSTNQLSSVFSKEVIVANEEAFGRIKLVKKDHEIDTKLSGAKFNIVDATGKVVDTVVTGKDGVAYSKELPFGSYKAIEVEAPKGYVLSNKEIDFTLAYKDQVTKLVEVARTILNVEFPPEIGTTLTGLEGEKAVDPLKETVLKDVVNITGAIVGKWYDIIGHLRVVETGEKLMYQGKEVAASTRVLAKEPNFTVELFFTFDARDLHGKNVVAFEDAYTGGCHVASEAKIDNPPQTVRIRNPCFKTKANINGEKTVVAGGKYTVMDLIMYEDFSPNKWYEFVGTIANPVTKQDLVINGKVPTGVAYVRPETENGEAVVEIELEDTTGLDGTFVVLETGSRLLIDKENPTEEELKNAKKEVIAEHKDYEDKEQQFTIVPPAKPQLPATGEEDFFSTMFMAVLSFFGGLLLFFKKEQQ